MCLYATVSLPESVLIIGGSDSTNPTYDIDNVAEFKVRAPRNILMVATVTVHDYKCSRSWLDSSSPLQDNIWTNKGALKSKRRGHGAARHGNHVFVFGGAGGP